MDEAEIPKSDCMLLYLGPAAIYRNNVGLDKYEGFTANTNYLLPWTLATMMETTFKETKGASDMPKKTVIDRNEWPLPGKYPTRKEFWPSDASLKPVAAPAKASAATAATIKSPPPVPPTVSFDAFPALGSTREPEVPTPVPNALDMISSKSIEEPKKENGAGTADEQEKENNDWRVKYEATLVQSTSVH